MAERRHIAVTVKTYPNPSTKHGETVCTAGVDLDLGRFVRLYPVRLRDLPSSRWFKKWHVVEADLTHKTSDCRGDTLTPDPRTIRTVDAFYKGAKRDKADWPRRDALVLPMASTMERLQLDANAFRGSIGLVRISEDSTFAMMPDSAEWSDKQQAIMSQQSLFGDNRRPLQKVPWKFRYRFRCADNPECPGHDLQVFDWEPYELYRGQLARWGADKAKQDVLDKYNAQMGPSRRNVHLFVGTTIDHPTQFSCIGIYSPPHQRHVRS
jgi:hypothetical protein